MNHEIKIPDAGMLGFARAVPSIHGPVTGREIRAGLAGMFAAMAPEELRELAASLLTMANALESRGAQE